MIIASLIMSFVTLTSQGPVMVVSMQETTNVGLCRNLAYQGRNDGLVDEIGVPKIEGCFEEGSSARDAFMNAHRCDPQAIKFKMATADEKRDGAVMTVTYLCSAP